MDKVRQNYYGSLCTEMYEILHEKAPEDELDFYLSYARKGMKIMEPLCGSGRFLIPFLENGFDICGMDLSEEMLKKLKQKSPCAKAIQTDILKYTATDKYDYIFIPSGSVSLFTDINVCKDILRKIRGLLAPGGVFVFAVDTVSNRCEDNSDYKTDITVKTKEGLELLLKSRHYYEEQSQTQFSPGILELYQGTKLLQSEPMDFQTHLYKLGEMDQYLRECGFQTISVYSSFEKESVTGEDCEIFIYECGNEVL